MKNQRISIIMSVYNSEKTISRAIESVINQIYSYFEFLIIDDGSVDKSLSIIEKYKKSDERIRIFRNKKNIGLTKSLNIGLDNSKYDLIARIDADDWWRKDKLEKQVEFLNCNEEYVVIGTNVINVNTISKKKKSIEKPQTDSEIRTFLFRGAPFVHSSIVFRKKCINRYDEIYYTSQDYELYYRLLKVGKGYNVQEILTFRETHRKNSITTKNLRLHKINDIKIRWKIFKLYKPNLAYYLYFVPDILALLIPAWLKTLKNKLQGFFNN